MTRADRIEQSLRGAETVARDAGEDLRRLWREVAITEASGGVEARWEDLARVLDALDRLGADTKVLRDEISDLIGARMTFAEKAGTAVEGLGLVRFHAKKDSERWDPAAVARDVADRLGARLSDETGLYADGDSGEILPTSEVIRRVAARTVEAMVGLCGMTPSASWRATPLKALGLDPKAYRDVEYGQGGTVRIERGVIDTTKGDGDE